MPDLRLAEAILRWAGRATAWTDLPESVTCTGATAADGSRLRFLHNWSWQPTAVTAPVERRDILSGKPLPAGEDIDLAAWDVRILTETPPTNALAGGDNS